MDIIFSKMEGLGNDFVIIDDRDEKIREAIAPEKLAIRMCDRHFGIGADGIIFVGASIGHDIEFIIFNSNGSEAQMCGNGMRCFAAYLFERDILVQKCIRVATKAGTIVPEVLVNDKGQVISVKVDMGVPMLDPALVPFIPSDSHTLRPGCDEILDLGDALICATVVSMGNPHTVVFVDDLSLVDVEKTGRALETHKSFPQKTNVEFVQIINSSELKMKVWERGVGITLGCGTGACASLVAAHITGRAQRKARIRLDGGELEIFWNPLNNHVYKTGPVRFVFNGIYTLPD